MEHTIADLLEDWQVKRPARHCDNWSVLNAEDEACVYAWAFSVPALSLLYTDDLIPLKGLCSD